MCNNNGICGCIGNNWWWIIILLLLFCNGNSWGTWNNSCGCGCENNNCGCC